MVRVRAGVAAAVQSRTQHGLLRPRIDLPHRVDDRRRYQLHWHRDEDARTGMSLNRLPIFVYGTMTASFAAIFALPALTAGCVFLYLERQFHMHFFDAAQGGSPLLWQHLFWILGHPWVYIIVLPAMGMVSEMIPTFCRRPLVGYPYVALST